MTDDIKNSDFIEEKEEHLSIMRGLVDGTLLTRSFFTKQMPFLLFLAFLGVVYISNRYHADRTRNNLVKLKNELLELRSEALYTASQLMKMGRQTEVAREVKKKGIELKESMEPPKIIKTR